MKWRHCIQNCSALHYPASCSPVPSGSTLNCNTQHSVMHRHAVHCSSLHRSALHYTSLHCNALLSSILQCNALLHCTVLYCGTQLLSNWRSLSVLFISNLDVYTVQCTVYVLDTVYNLQCTGHSPTLYTIHYTLYTIHYAHCNFHAMSCNICSDVGLTDWATRPRQSQ